jgi:hypothetical protein
VGSFVIENRHVTTDQAEERVERQAREFELLKPYLIERWTEGRPDEPAGPPRREATPAVTARVGGVERRGNGRRDNAAAR